VNITTKNKQRNQREKNAPLTLKQQWNHRDHRETKKKKIPTQDLNRKLGVQLIGEMKSSRSSRGEREREVDEKVR
jgi:hypothetical protein